MNNFEWIQKTRKDWVYKNPKALKKLRGLRRARWKQIRKEDSRYEGHPIGYCSDQMCCWGPKGARVQWA